MRNKIVSIVLTFVSLISIASVVSSVSQLITKFTADVIKKLWTNSYDDGSKYATIWLY